MYCSSQNGFALFNLYQFGMRIAEAFDAKRFAEEKQVS